MLRILDARTGEPVPAAPSRRGLTRIEAHVSGPDPTALRVLLTADLLVRALELGGTPVWAALAASHRPAELRTAATTLSIRPFEDARDLPSGLGEAQVIHVTAETPDASGAGPVVRVAPVEWTGEATGGPSAVRPLRDRAPGSVSEPAPAPAPEPAPGPPAEPASGAVSEPAPASAPGPAPDSAAESAPAGGPESASGAVSEPAPAHAPGPAAPPPLAVLLADPCALRLAVLSVPRGEPVRLDSAVLEEAAGRLAGWRRAVAGWARQPSRPVPDEVRARLRSAWEDDLDLPGVLEVLRAVESAPDLPDGARFETYVYADRLLALDLARDLGSPA
ncbi:hypothetical protein [Streptomyces puniciscabiei]|uniref:hypothetical protein n=1 Tax=Streptomyces puniciscabiei TaxID=164348 RepID=UPI001F2C67CB|nr:hypothetical protein [Streptomyces puniciscabiei]